VLGHHRRLEHRQIDALGGSASALFGLLGQLFLGQRPVEVGEVVGLGVAEPESNAVMPRAWSTRPKAPTGRR
jgi:hypothetical protein